MPSSLENITVRWPLWNIILLCQVSYRMVSIVDGFLLMHAAMVEVCGIVWHGAETRIFSCTYVTYTYLHVYEMEMGTSYRPNTGNSAGVELLHYDPTGLRYGQCVSYISCIYTTVLIIRVHTHPVRRGPAYVCLYKNFFSKQVVLISQ